MRIILIILVFLSALPAQAEDVYQDPDAFIAEVFGGNPPESKSLWFAEEWQRDINKIMDRKYRVMHTKYWEKNGRTVWILEEIGKVKPITTGIVINNDAIERVKVLIYRESHGWEVKHRFFTEQFDGAALKSNYKLTETIDNISGATMSVDALRNLGELALFLHKHRND